METMQIEVLHPKAHNLLKDLEELKIIKILKKNTISIEKPSEYFRGSISKKAGEELKEFSKKSREEWERII
jgi:hypothetical protein